MERSSARRRTIPAACEYLVWLPSGSECGDEGFDAALDGRGEPARIEDRALCTIPQLVPESRAPGAAPPTGDGWYYDTFSTSGDRSCDAPATEVPRIVLVGARPPSGSTVDLWCVEPSSGVGTRCMHDVPVANPCPELRSPEGATLSCDPLLHECGVACASSADCRDAGLLGRTCDTRSFEEIDPWRFAGDERAYGFCVRPICE